MGSISNCTPTGRIVVDPLMLGLLRAALEGLGFPTQVLPSSSAGAVVLDIRRCGRRVAARTSPPPPPPSHASSPLYDMILRGGIEYPCGFGGRRLSSRLRCGVVRGPGVLGTARLRSAHFVPSIDPGHCHALTRCCREISVASSDSGKTRTSRSKSYLNGVPVPLKVLRQASWTDPAKILLAAWDRPRDQIPAALDLTAGCF